MALLYYIDELLGLVVDEEKWQLALTAAWLFCSSATIYMDFAVNICLTVRRVLLSSDGAELCLV
jgi:hypothetical protein